MKKLLRLGTAEIRLSTLNIVSEEANEICPVVHHVTAVVHKVTTTNHAANVILLSTPFKEIAELVKIALENMEEKIPEGKIEL